MASRELLVTIGLPASGKSTWAAETVRELNSEGLEVVRIERDGLRSMLFDHWNDPDFYVRRSRKNFERFVTEAQQALIALAAKHDLNVIVSDTNINVDTVERLRSLAAAHGFDYLEKSFLDVPLKELLRRDRARPNGVGDKVMRAFHAKLSAMADDRPKQYVRDPSLPEAFVFDVDGTIAEKVTDRSSYDNTRYLEDGVHADVVAFMHRLKSEGYAIVVLTGREDRDPAREHTLEWLRVNGIPHDAFHMRRLGDRRQDAVVKREIFFDEVAPKFGVLACFDDRDSVVEMWRSIGLRVYQVSDGDF